jgi:hypothetical protein
MGDQELISALKAHYPISVQKIWLAQQSGSAEEIICFLRQMDEIETKDQSNRTDKGTPNSFSVHITTRGTDSRTGAMTRIR